MFRIRSKEWNTGKLLFILLAMTLVNVSAAHHRVKSQYSLNTLYTIEGVLKRVEIASPHSFLHVLVIDENGDERIVRVEWGSAASLNRNLSLNRSSIRTEQRIRVPGYLSNSRDDFMIWPMTMVTEFDLDYDRIDCNVISKSGGKCAVLTDIPPLWPVLDINDQ
jgi:hypothetical protein